VSANARDCQGTASQVAEKVFLSRSASLRACLRQSGIVDFQQLSGTAESRALTQSSTFQSFSAASSAMPKRLCRMAALAAEKPGDAAWMS